MDKNAFLTIIERLMRCPAAPYFEDLVAAEVQAICQENELQCERDQFGNFLVSVASDPTRRPIVLAAHMDHPGFVIRETIGSGRFQAEFLGGVPDNYFSPGLRVLLMPGRIRAQLAERIGEKKVFAIQSTSTAQHSFAVWDLSDFELHHALVHGRACDDLIGVASILATLITLEQNKAAVHVMGLISRAEEIGFHGALAAINAGTIPKSALVISLETSRELPSVKMNSGVILRVGDRASVFDPVASRFLLEVATDLHKSMNPENLAGSFRFQRALMSGGTCEATAYQEYGFQTAALCVALGNYHNCGESNRIQAEFVSVPDALAMIELLVEAAARMHDFPELVSRLPKKLEGFTREAIAELQKRPLP